MAPAPRSRLRRDTDGDTHGLPGQGQELCWQGKEEKVIGTENFATSLRVGLGTLLAAGGLALAFVPATPAAAFTTSTGTLNVTASIGTTCTVGNVSIGFGTITTAS